MPPLAPFASTLRGIQCGAAASRLLTASLAASQGHARFSIVASHPVDAEGSSNDSLLDSVSITAQQRAEINAIPARLQEHVDDGDLLIQALTHRSFHQTRHNGRLAELGRSIISMIVTDALYTRFPNMLDSTISDIRSRFLSEDVLGPIGRQLGFQDALLYKFETPLVAQAPRPFDHSKRAKYHKQPTPPQKIPLSATADAFQAFVGAVAKDSSLDAATAFVNDFVVHIMENENLDDFVKLEHPKLLLSYISNSNNNDPIEYKVEQETGRLSHLPTFLVAVYSGEAKLGSGTGFTLLQAEQNAARNVLREHFLKELGDAPLPADIAE